MAQQLELPSEWKHVRTRFIVEYRSVQGTWTNRAFPLFSTAEEFHNDCMLNGIKCKPIHRVTTEVWSVI
jgi:hypothetical protein